MSNIPASSFIAKARKRAPLLLTGAAVLAVALAPAGLGGCQRTAETTSPQTAPQTTLPTAAQTATSVRFATIGDFGYDGPALAGVSSLIHSWNPDHILALGDNNYDVGSASTIDANIGKHFHTNGLDVSSSEASTPANRPKLTVTYQ